MPNHCNAIGCTGVGSDGEKVGFFQFPFKKAPHLLEYWVSFVSRDGWKPNPEATSQGLCSRHFDEKYVEIGKTGRFYLRWNLNPVPTKQFKSTVSYKSCFRTPSVPRKDPATRVFRQDEIDKFKKGDEIKSLDDIKAKHAPDGY